MPRGKVLGCYRPQGVQVEGMCTFFWLSSLYVLNSSLIYRLHTLSRTRMAIITLSIAGSCSHAKLVGMSICTNNLRPHTIIVELHSLRRTQRLCHVGRCIAPISLSFLCMLLCLKMSLHTLHRNANHERRCVLLSWSEWSTSFVVRAVQSCFNK